MRKDSKIYVAGHRGLAGSAITRKLIAEGYTNIVTRGHQDLDLTDPVATRAFFEHERPEYVFLAAAKVGGIAANNDYPVQFIRENLSIQTNVIHESWRVGVKRLLFLGSSCIYPRDCPQPIKEEYFLTGPLEPTNRAYAIAKIAGVEMCWSYNRQYGTKYLCAMPTNLYGNEDNYDLRTSHVIPALLRKMHEAKVNGVKTVEVWGSGLPMREFLSADELADACLFISTLPDEEIELITTEVATPPILNIGSGAELSILSLARMVAEVVQYSGELVFDRSKPDGTYRKVLNVEKLGALGWSSKVSLREGLASTYQHFVGTSLRPGAT